MPEADLTGACPRVMVEQSRSCGVEDIDAFPASGCGESLNVSVAEKHVGKAVIVPGIDVSAVFGTGMVVVAATVVVGIAADNVRNPGFSKGEELRRTLDVLHGD